MANNIKKVKLKYLINTSNVKNDKDYKWDILRNSIKEKGYDSENYGLIGACNIYKNYYLIFDGHHRVFILNELYGEDYEIDIDNRSILKTILSISFLPIIFLIIYICKFVSTFIKYHRGKLVK